jgi:soluble lytic murein transglycosylase-like protein
LLIRSIIIKATLLIFVFPIFAFAQSQREVSGQSAEGREMRRPATLTTMDTLDPKDFAKPAAVSNVSKAEPPKKTGAEISRAEVITTVQRDVPVMTPVVTAVNPVSTGDAKLDGWVTAAAARYGLDPRLMVAIMRQESSFNSRAVSPKGARGLMQLMPATAARFGVRDMMDPVQNIEGGAQYLRFLLDTFNGNVELALAGYNAGENAVARYGNRVPPYRETVDYVQRISAHYNRLTNGAGWQPAVSNLTAVAERRSGPELIVGVRALSQY